MRRLELFLFRHVGAFLQLFQICGWFNPALRRRRQITCIERAAARDEIAGGSHDLEKLREGQRLRRPTRPAGEAEAHARVRGHSTGWFAQEVIDHALCQLGALHLVAGRRFLWSTHGGIELLERDLVR